MEMLHMECEGPQDLRCGMLEPSITTPPIVKTHDNATIISVRYDMDKLYQYWIILLIQIEFDRFSKYSKNVSA